MKRTSPAQLKYWQANKCISYLDRHLKYCILSIKKQTAEI